MWGLYRSSFVCSFCKQSYKCSKFRLKIQRSQLLVTISENVVANLGNYVKQIHVQQE